MNTAFKFLQLSLSNKNTELFALSYAQSKRNKWKRVLNRPRLNSAIDFRLLAVLELTKVNEKQRLAQGGFEPA